MPAVPISIILMLVAEKGKGWIYTLQNDTPHAISDEYDGTF
jgi:hypothetical protein